MDDLYPGKGRGGGFQANGFAEAFGTRDRLSGRRTTMAVNSGVPIVWKTKGTVSAARDAFRLVLQHGRDRIKQPPRSGIHRKPRGIDDG